MRLVVAIGGNALLKRGEPPDLALQRRRACEAVAALGVILGRHAVLLTHGNGPQVGLLALQTEALRGGPCVPLDVLDAESEGLIGYVLQQELESAQPDREVVALLTEVEVDPHDPALSRATKPIGPVYDTAQGRRLASERGWAMLEEAGGLRRGVPSPRPVRIRGLGAIRQLLDSGAIVVCGGGGGIPVVVDASGRVRGVEAVIDKDHSAALLAEGVQADALLLLTDVAGVYEGFASPRARLIVSATPDDLRARRLEPGSMGPKVAAACRFVERTGGWAAIGALEQAEQVAHGLSGTLITPTRSSGSSAQRFEAVASNEGR